MNIIKTISPFLLIASGHRNSAAAAIGDDIPTLEGAAPAAKSNDHYNLNHFDQEDHTTTVDDGGVPRITKIVPSSDTVAATNTAASYTYRLQINATLPLAHDYSGLVIDRCVEWAQWSNGANFTWYGFRIQLPDDASTRSGFHFPDAMRATEELGLVLPYNNTPPDTILEYNISTQESQPIIKINFNDQPFWNTYIFDFVNQQGSIVSDGSDYQEFKRTMNGAITCYGVNNGGSRAYLAPVIPTLTISLQRFDEGGGTAPSPSPTPPSAAVLPYGTLPGLGLAVITVVGALVFL